MKFIITKLDRRYKGRNQFTHYITPVWGTSLANKLQFVQWRTWCWETWGPGLERDLAIELMLPVRWGWQQDAYTRRLYFVSEKELRWFILKWSSE
jgi:hypothetical protein